MEKKTEIKLNENKQHFNLNLSIKNEEKKFIETAN